MDIITDDSAKIQSQYFHSLGETLSLIAFGLDVIPLLPRQKRPDALDWSTAPRHTADTFRAAYKLGGNIGLRTGRAVAGGFLHVIDVDVDVDTPESLAALHELVPADVVDLCPAAASGNASGNRRHLYILTDESLARSRRIGGWGKIELLGLGQQVVLPPSIHPDSGRPYRWLPGRHLDPDLAELIGEPVAPFIPSERCRAWGAQRAEERLEDMVADRPRDWDASHVGAALAAIPPAEDRDTWLKVGAALHHGSEASEEGLDLWLEWSARSAFWQAQPAKAEREVRET